MTLIRYSCPCQRALALKKQQSSDLLFRRIRIFWDVDINSLYPLLAYFVDQPELADSVREIAVDAEPWAGHQSIRHNQDTARAVLYREIDDGMHDRMEDYVRNMGLTAPITRTMIAALQRKKGQVRNGIRGEETRECNAWEREFASTATAMLMSLCKNITTMYLGMLGYSGSSVGIFLMLASMGRVAQPALQNVKHVELIAGVNGASEREYSLINLKKYFNLICRLPALESVVADGIADCESSYQTFPPRVSTMRRLEITHADVSNDALGKILSVPRSLEEFTLSLGGFEGAGPDVSPDFLGERLAMHRETLRRLDIDIDHAICGNNVRENELTSAADGLPNGSGVSLYSIERQLECEELPPSPSEIPIDRELGQDCTIGTLSDYKALTNLSIGIKTLLGSGQTSSMQPFRLIDVLPASLEYLCIYDYERGQVPYVDGQIDEFLEEKGEKLPLLRVVMGIEEKLEGEMAGEGYLWERSERELDWVRV